MSAYTDADVLAAAHALNTDSAARGRIRQHADRDVRLVLDAVAPAIAARALREAAEADWPWPVTSASSPYVMHEWLRARADEIERTP